MIAFTLPLPPSKNKMHGYGRGHIYPSRERTDYISIVGQIVCFEHPEIRREFVRSDWIIIWMDWYLPRRHTDCHNLHATLCDALQKAIEVNDCWYLLRDVAVQYDKFNPRVEIEMCYASDIQER